MTRAVMARPSADARMWWKPDRALGADGGYVRRTGPRRPCVVKVVVTGGFAAGKTTFVAAGSELAVVTTEMPLPPPGLDVARPDLVGPDLVDIGRAVMPIRGKATTTTALDFGRVTFTNDFTHDLTHCREADLCMYLFGTSGLPRFWAVWQEVCRSAAGAIVLVDSRRLDACFPAVDFFDHHRVPYLVVVNEFDGVGWHQLGDVRDALAIDASVPVLACDARDRAGVRRVLTAFAAHILGWPPPPPTDQAPFQDAAIR
jgi:uncharacterized protein